MPLGEYLEGLAFLLPTLAACALAAAVVARRRYRHLLGAERALAYALLASLAVLAAHVVPLALGVLARGTVLATALALAALSLLVRTRDDPIDPVPPPVPPRAGRASVVLATLGTAVFAVFLIAQLRTTLTTPVTHVDTVSFHVPGIARWIQSGSLWQVDQLFPLHVTGNYPNNGDALTMAAVLPWREAAFVRVVPVIYLLLAGLGVYAIARRLGASVPTGVLAGTALASLPSATYYALEGLPDSIMLFGFATGVLFLLRHRDSTSGNDLVLAGLGVGLAFGTKWYGLTVTAALFAVWIASRVLSRDLLRVIARDGAAVIALILAASGVWFVRNLVESGNPIFPQEVGAFGVTIFDGTEDAAVDRTGFSLVEYLDDLDVLADYAVPGLWGQLGIAGPLALLAVLVALAALLFARRRGARDDQLGQIAALSAVAVLVTALWAITPGSAPGREGEPQVFITIRWLIPAALLGLVVLAALGRRLGRVAVAVDALLVAAIVDGALSLPTRPATGLVLKAIVAIAAVALASVLAWRMLPRFRELSARSRRAITVGGVALATLAAVSFARWEQDAYLDGGYAAYDPTFEWIEQNAPEGTRIGIAGTSSLDGVSPILPAFGPRLENDIRYVGPFVDELLREYHSRRAFVDSLRDSDDELLIIGRGLIPRKFVEEEDWAQSIGYRRIVASRRLALYAAPGTAAAPVSGSG